MTDNTAIAARAIATYSEEEVAALVAREIADRIAHVARFYPAEERGALDHAWSSAEARASELHYHAKGRASSAYWGAMSAPGARIETYLWELGVFELPEGYATHEEVAAIAPPGRLDD
jgi:hypothetical protein